MIYYVVVKVGILPYIVCNHNKNDIINKYDVMD